MNTRRNFLKGFGIMGAVVAVSAAARQYQYEQEKPELTDEDIKRNKERLETLLKQFRADRVIGDKK